MTKQAESSSNLYMLEKLMIKDKNFYQLQITVCVFVIENGFIGVVFSW
jgi:hypothetical protein